MDRSTETNSEDYQDWKNQINDFEKYIRLKVISLANLSSVYQNKSVLGVKIDFVIPEEDILRVWRWFSRVDFLNANRVEVCAIIDKFQRDFDTMYQGIKKVEEEEEVNAIHDLRKFFLETMDRAMAEKRSTNSFVVYGECAKLVKEKEEYLRKLEKIETFLTRKALDKFQEKLSELDECKKTINMLREENENLKEKHKSLLENKEKLLNSFEKMMVEKKSKPED